MAVGFDGDEFRRQALLERVLHWTNGHPYLTQKLCQLVASQEPPCASPKEIDGIVMAEFVSPGKDRLDSNLSFVRMRMQGSHEPARRQQLKLYRSILNGGNVLDQPGSPGVSGLQLTGLVKPDSEGRLHVRNRIYEQVFGEAWSRQ